MTPGWRGRSRESSPELDTARSSTSHLGPLSEAEAAPGFERSSW